MYVFLYIVKETLLLVKKGGDAMPKKALSESMDLKILSEIAYMRCEQRLNELKQMLDVTGKTIKPYDDTIGHMFEVTAHLVKALESDCRHFYEVSQTFGESRST